MESDEFRTVRVYTKKYTSKDKDGNTVEKESECHFFPSSLIILDLPIPCLPTKTTRLSNFIPGTNTLAIAATNIFLVIAFM